MMRCDGFAKLIVLPDNSVNQLHGLGLRHRKLTYFR